ncbi:exosortase 1 [Alicycliphilus sp. B1]|nr:exosortase 1 [Alicycliphilus sp. B1]
MLQAAILAIYWHSAWGMAMIWARSDTYAHGFVCLSLLCGWCGVNVPHWLPWCRALGGWRGSSWRVRQRSGWSAIWFP